MSAAARLDRSRLKAIVIGASAGAVEALSVVLPAMRAGLAVPVFVVVHVPRERPSLLATIFEPKIALAAREALDKEPVEPGTVVFAPPDYHLLVERGRDGKAPTLALAADAPVHHSRPSIDVLFESASRVYGDGLLAIVLTGASADGAAGLAAAHAAGATTVVQRPDSALAPTMPQAALDRVDATHVLDLPGIAALVAEL
jgi:two-component system chemotaxis response regulator CheB